MNWFVETKTHRTVTTAVVSGPLDANAFFQMRDRVRQQQVAQGGQSVLLDLRQTILKITTLDVFAIASSHRDVFPVEIPFAVLIRPATFIPGDARFLENVLVNRGTVAKVFTDEAAARTWMTASVEAS